MSDVSDTSDAYMLEFARELRETLRLGGGFLWALANDAIGERASRDAFSVRNQYCHPPIGDEVFLLCVQEWLLVREGARYLLVLVPLLPDRTPDRLTLQLHFTCATPQDGAPLFHAAEQRFALTLYNEFER